MKIKFIKLLVLLVFLISLYSCTTAKEVLGGKKRSEQSDEFLVEKKNSLAMPPDFEKLPTPIEEGVISQNNESSEEIKSLLNLENTNQNENSSNAENLESSILKKIK